ncbi:hypothetical protein LZ30DRAFT_781615 [Colletotrichum cereale]|nr:hypothetical protein LZ30DRAFT_781615 [Colletotrichum cereale]
MALWDEQFADFVSYCQHTPNDVRPPNTEIAARYLQLEQQLSVSVDAVDLRAQLPSPILEAIVSTFDPNPPSSNRILTLRLRDAPGRGVKRNAAGITTGDLRQAFDKAKLDKSDSMAEPAAEMMAHERAQGSPTDINHDHERHSLEETPSPAKKRRATARPPTEQLTNDPLACLRPHKWVLGSVVSSSLSAVSNLWADSVMLLDGLPAELAGHEKRHATKLEMLLESQPECGVFVLLPAEVDKHWTVAVACIKDGLGTIRVFDSLARCGRSEPHAVEAAVLLQQVVDVAAAECPGQLARVQALAPVATWPRPAARSAQQVGDNDCGVGVILHVFHTLAGVAVPHSADWLLWRRIIATFLRTQNKQQSTPGVQCTSDHLREAHDELLSAGMTMVRTPHRPLGDINQLLPQYVDLATSQQLEASLGDWYHAVRAANAHAEEQYQARRRQATTTEQSLRLILQALRAGAWRSKEALDRRAICDDKTASIKCLQHSIDGIRRQGNDESTVRFLEDRIRTLNEEQQSAVARRQAREDARAASEGGLDAIAVELDLMLESLAGGLSE